MSNKDYLVEEFSLRWNYVLPAYPPVNFDYKPSLKSLQLNSVTSEQFAYLKNVTVSEEAKAVVPETKKSKKTDKNANSAAEQKKEDMKKLLKHGTTLVHQIEFYAGLFVDSEGKMYDLRPNTESIIRPSLSTFHKMEKSKLQSLLLDAYTKQLEELQKSDHETYDREFEQEVLTPQL